jgi:hypothetical protein
MLTLRHHRDVDTRDVIARNVETCDVIERVFVTRVQRRVQVTGLAWRDVCAAGSCFERHSCVSFFT